jgi:hypothetical protein
MQGRFDPSRVFTSYKEEEEKKVENMEREKRGRVFANHPTELLLLLYLVSLTVLGLRLFSICRRDGCRNNDRLLRHSPSIVLLSAWSRPSGHTHTEREKENNRPESFENMQNQIIFSFSLRLGECALFGLNARRMPIAPSDLSHKSLLLEKKHVFYFMVEGDRNWDRVLALIPANMVIRKRDNISR